MSKKKIEVGDWVHLVGPFWKRTYPDAPEYVRVTEIEEDMIYADPVADVGSAFGGLYSPGPSEDIKGTASPERLEELTQIASGIPFVEELKALHDPISPNHYDYPGGVQVIDLTRHMDFLLGNVVKYVARAGRKGNRLEDLKKAETYLRWAIEDEATK